MGANRLGLSGGETLLHRDIDYVIEEAIKLGFEVGINSNGILVPNHLSALSKVNNLTIGLDGATPETHDRYRGRGAFEKAMGGIIAAYEAGIHLHLAFTLTKANAYEWRAVLGMGQKFNAWVQFNPLLEPIFETRRETTVKRLSPERLKEILAEILEEKKKGAPVFASEETLRLLMNWPEPDRDHYPFRMKGHPVCLAGRKMIFIDNRGTMYPCLRVSGQKIGRNCFDLGLREAYKSLPPPPCKSCRWPCFLDYNAILNLWPSALSNLHKIRSGWNSSPKGNGKNGRE